MKTKIGVMVRLAMMALAGEAGAVEYVVTKSDGVLTTGYPFQPEADDMVEILHKGRDVSLVFTFADGVELNASARTMVNVKLIGLTSVVPFEAREHAILWKVTPRDENGQKEQEDNFKNGKREGPMIKWHENGEKRLVVTYKDGKKEGPETAWHDNGQKRQEGIYKDGKREGSYTDWHANGQKMVEATYIGGKPDGVATRWDENGVVVSQVHFKNGVEVGD